MIRLFEPRLLATAMHRWEWDRFAAFYFDAVFDWRHPYNTVHIIRIARN